MGRTKRAAPQKLDASKRQCMQWNMQDLQHGLVVVDDNDPSLLQEQLQAQGASLSATSSRDAVSSKSSGNFTDSDIEEMLNKCLFGLTIHNGVDFKGEWNCELGTFTLDIRSLENLDALKCCKYFWLYVNMDKKNHLLYIFNDTSARDTGESGKCNIFKASSCMPIRLLQGLQGKCFYLENACLEDSQLQVKVYMLESGLTKLHFSCEGINTRKINNTALRDLMAHFYAIPFPDYSGENFNTKHDIDELYEEVRRRHLEVLTSISINPQHPSLKPRLRPYQQDAVIWMLSKETVNQSSSQSKGRLHDLYQEVVTPNGQVLYYNRHGAMLVKEKPLAEATPPGGVLADEMGLGKTVEVLACMLCHPRTNLPPVEPMAVAEIIWEAEIEQEVTTVGTGKRGRTRQRKHETKKNLEQKIEISDQETAANAYTEVNSEIKEYIAVKPELTAPSKQPDTASSVLYHDTPSKWDLQSEDQHENNVKHENIPQVDGEGGIGNEDKTELPSDVEVMDIGQDVVVGSDSSQDDVPLPNVDHNYAHEELAVVISDSESLDSDVLMLEPLRCLSCGTEASPSAAASVAASAAALSCQPGCSTKPDISFTCERCIRLKLAPSNAHGTNRSNNNKNAKITDKNTKRKAPILSKKVPKPQKKAQTPKKKMPRPKKATQMTRRKKDKEESGNETPEDNDDDDYLPASQKGRKKMSIRITSKKQISKAGKGKRQKRKPASRRKRKPKASVKKEDTHEQLDNSNVDSTTTERKPRTTRRRSSKPTYELVEEDQLTPTYSEELSKPAPQKKLLECVCGSTQRKQEGLKVQCCSCGQWQHADCVHYDVTDPYRGIYKCPHCHVASEPIASGATLIISPSSISYQWADEIKKHIHDKDIRMFIYTGVHKQGFIQPQTLANHDIVITTYETLRKEIDYVDLPHSNSEDGRRFRHPKRFMAIPSPIIAVEWWRICLDEAQMVECTTTKTAEMALRLSAVNRWCVTGTPIQRGINDLFGLVLFLRTDPYWVQTWWTKLLYEPFCFGHKEPLYQMLAKVLWRTSKKHVLDQICLPAQTETMHWLTFTPVEEHFYRSQYQRCSSQVSQSLRKCPGPDGMRLNTLDRYTLHMLLNPMTSLRQACCHPNAVRGEFRAINKSNLTMEELLVSLTKKARLECEEAHRQYVFANNALAALDIINNKYTDAVEKYREVLRSVEEHKAEFRTDELQLLHTLHNLQEILSSKAAGVPPTLRDDQLADQCKTIKEKYLTKASTFVKSTEDGLGPVSTNLKDMLQEFKGQHEWWLEMLHWIGNSSLAEALVHRVKDDLTDNTNYAMESMVRRFRDIRGLQYILATQLDDLNKSREKVLKTVQALRGDPSRDTINKTTECCLRPADPEILLKNCPFCKADEDFEDYENKLFFFIDKGVTGVAEEEQEENEVVKKATRFFVSTKRQGTWADSETEKALKSLLSFSRTYKADRKLLQSGALHLKIFEELKKEYKLVHRVFMALKENVATYDELDMATTRLRLRLPEEPVPETHQPNILEPMELEAQKLKFNSDRIVSTNELKKKLGQLLYLKNLAKTQDALQGGKNPELCPICQAQLGTRWSVMQCGHCFCFDCIQIMMERHPKFGGRNNVLKCAVCRQTTPIGNISYVSTRAVDQAEEGAIKVKGDHSTKVVGVVRCLLQIQQEDPSAKCLVFSTWQGVLDILAKALDDNGIMYKSLMAQNKFQNNLWNFKQSENIKVLLLPVHSGANGLNLIEATHVLLVEPILNPAQELQAIGRVHRIGQTKPTFVHRFIVKGTIEERMHRLLSTVQAPTNSHSSEETTMTLGDLKSLFKDTPMSVQADHDMLEVQEVPADDAVDAGASSDPHLRWENSVAPACNGGSQTVDAESHAEIQELQSETFHESEAVIQENQTENLTLQSENLQESHTVKQEPQRSSH